MAKDIGEPKKYFDDDEERDRKWNEALEVIDSDMTPDEAYAKSVAESGRAEGISDQADAAARIPEADMREMRKDAGLPEDGNEPAPSAQNGYNGGNTSYGTGAYGIISNKTPQAELDARARREEDARQRRSATRAARAAEAEKRQELLESGKYFDDGRGNLVMKKEYRTQRYATRGGLRNKTMPDDGSGNAAVRAAGRDAFDIEMAPDPWAQAAARQKAQKGAASRQYTANMVAANNADMEAMEKRRADAGRNDAKGRLSIFDGLAAAFGDMNRKFERQGEGDVTEETVAPEEKFKRDANGKTTTEFAERVKTGRRFVDGFLSKDRVMAINNHLAELGNKRVRITGVMARQRLGVDSKTKDGDPIFIVSGVHYDKATGTNKPFQWVRSLEDVYRFGKENGIASGLDSTEADENVIAAIGDVFGNRARRNAALESKWRIAEANNKAKEKVAQIQAQGRADAARVSAELKRMGYDIDVAKLEESRRHNQAMEKNAADRAAGRGTGSGSGTGGKYDDKYAERLKGDWLDAEERYEKDPTPENKKVADENHAKYNRYVDSFGGGEGVSDGEGMTPQQRAQAILAARRQNGGGTGEPKNTASTPAQGEGRTATATAARQPEVAATSESVRDEIIGGKKPSATAEKPTAQTQGNDKPVQSGGEPSKSMQLRERNAKLKGPYASIPENVLAEFRDLYPNVSDAEINSGKHDQVLRNIAKNMGDKTTAENLDARDEQRRRMDEDAERTERRAQNRAAVSEGEDRMASFRREMSAFEKSWDKSKRRMRAEGTYNEEYVKNYENRKRAEIRRKFGLKEDGSEDKTGSVTHRANRAIAAMDEK